MESEDIVNAKSLELENDWGQVTPLHLRYRGDIQFME